MNFIIKRRKLIISIVLVLTLLGVYLMSKVKINYDLSTYLPKETETSTGLKIMEDEFGLISDLEIMVENTNIEKSNHIYSLIKDTAGVKAVDVDNSKEDKTLYLVTIDYGSYAKEARETFNTIKEKLRGYDYYMSGGVANANALTNTLQKEIPYFIIIAIVLILVILLILSASWIEPLIFLLISCLAIGLNYGSNIIFGSISFITFAICALLQLALSMDYSIILLDKYHHEEKDKEKEEAMMIALKRTFNTISSSSLTTIFGLLAMVFMSFTIGKDLGFVLAKGILINVLVVFLVLPGIVLSLDNVLKKTKKKVINIPVKIFTFIGVKGRYVVTVIMLLLFGGAFYFQSHLSLNYSYKFAGTEEEVITKYYGRNNPIILLYDNKMPEKNVFKVIEFLNNYMVDNKLVIKSAIDYHNTAGLKLSAAEFSQLYEIDSDLVNDIYEAYSTLNGGEERIELLNLINFIKYHATTNTTYQSYFSESDLLNLSSQSSILESSKELLSSSSYNRLIIRVNLPTEGKQMEKFFSGLKKVTQENLKESYILGESALSYGIKDTFGNEQLFITVLSIVAIFIIIALSSKSLVIPLILVFLIQGSIWISLSIPVFTNTSLFFMALIIAQCIQMGATIDYAILLAMNYKTYRKKKEKKDALESALKSSILTILTSGLILVVASLTIAFVSTQEMIRAICFVIGRGAITSTIVVLAVLPAYLIVFDRFFKK